MKKKFLLLLLVPLTLVSCNKGGVPFATIKEKVDQISDVPLFPYYRVRGSVDANGRVDKEIDVTFDRSPISGEPTPYARYNEGYYNEVLDGPKDKDIVIYGISSKSYFLRAPLRITKSNFYTTIADTVGSGMFDNMVLSSAQYDMDALSCRLGAIGSTITNAYARFLTPDNYNILTVTYKENEEDVSLELERTGTLKKDSSALFDGKYSDGEHTIILNQGEAENNTCAHSLIRKIITSYYGQQSSINPSNNQMTYELTSDGGFAFVGNKVHTAFLLDNYPYYPDPDKHPEVTLDNDDPLPCYKSIINFKGNIRLEYNAEGWLVRETAVSLKYDYKKSTDAQISLDITYTYKFSD